MYVPLWLTALTSKQTRRLAWVMYNIRWRRHFPKEEKALELQKGLKWLEVEYDRLLLYIYIYIYVLLGAVSGFWFLVSVLVESRREIHACCAFAWNIHRFLTKPFQGTWSQLRKHSLLIWILLALALFCYYTLALNTHVQQTPFLHCFVPYKKIVATLDTYSKPPWLSSFFVRACHFPAECGWAVTGIPSCLAFLVIHLSIETLLLLLLERYTHVCCTCSVSVQSAFVLCLFCSFSILLLIHC